MTTKKTTKAQKTAQINQQAAPITEDNTQAVVTNEQPNKDVKEVAQTQVATAAEVDGLMVRVVGDRPHFYRAGFCFTKAPMLLRIQDLSEAQLNALFSEPCLVVQEVTIPDEVEA